MAQVFSITATPRERLQLAILLLHRDLKLKGRSDEKKLFRARQALGLIVISEALLANKYDLAENSHQHDNRTKHRFTVTVENAEWVLTAIEPLELNPASSLFVEPLLQRLEAQEDSPDAAAADAYDEAAETPKWAPRLLAEPPRDDDEPEPLPPPPPPPPPAEPAEQPPAWT